MSRQNFVDGREDLLSSSCCLNGFDVGVGWSQPLIIYETNQQHPKCQAPTGCTQEALQPGGRLRGFTGARPGNGGCVLKLRGRGFFSAAHRQTSFLLTTSFLQAKPKPCEAFCFLFVIFKQAVL